MKNRKITTVLLAAAMAITLAACDVKDKEYVYGDFTGTYSGEWSGGKPDGAGSFEGEADNWNLSITGTWENGELVSAANYVKESSDGDEFIFKDFQYKNGKWYGTGHFEKITSSMNVYYDGEISESKYNGKGRIKIVTDEMTYSYEGEFVNDEKHGTGTGTFESNGEKEIFVGEFVNDTEYNGTYTYYYSDGTTETGVVENGKYSSDFKKKATGLLDDVLNALFGD